MSTCRPAGFVFPSDQPWQSFCPDADRAVTVAAGALPSFDAVGLEHGNVLPTTVPAR
jgi:hypothetical protein